MVTKLNRVQTCQHIHKLSQILQQIKSMLKASWKLFLPAISDNTANKPPVLPPQTTWHLKAMIIIIIIIIIRLCTILPLLLALCMANILMVMICSMCVLPSMCGPCWSNVLNSCRTRVAAPGNVSMLYRQDTYFQWYVTGTEANRKTQFSVCSSLWVDMLL